MRPFHVNTAASVLQPEMSRCNVAGRFNPGQQSLGIPELEELLELLDELDEQHGHPLIVSTVTGISGFSCRLTSRCQNAGFRHDQIAARTLHIGHDLNATG